MIVRIGRALIGKERRSNYTICLEPATAEKLRKLGDGNLSGGITKAAGIACKPRVRKIPRLERVFEEPEQTLEEKTAEWNRLINDGWDRD